MAEPILDHDMQRRVLLKLIHNPEMGFNELWGKDGESNTFAYHMHRLEESKLISKTARGTYALTEEGRKFSAFVEGDTGTKAEFPTLTIIILAKDSQGRYLCQRRLKEPFYGYWGFVSGKINFGYNLFECGARDLLEEAGLTAQNWKLLAFEQVKTFENSKLLFHHYLFFVEAEGVEGALKEHTHKADHEWLTMEDYHQKETFPRPGFFEHILNAARPVMVETERYMENGKFVGAKNIKVTTF